jgi:putative chitinase
LAWAADWNAYIEPLRDADSACWTPGNSVATSNHPGGTAIDLNWNSHPFQQRGSLNAAQMQTMSEMEAFYEGNVFWAGRWNSPADEMHSQVGYDTYDQKNDRPEPKVLDFIARKIRPDGFSTYRRGPMPAGPNPVDILVRATGLSTAKCAEIQPALSDGLRLAQCNNVNRIAMFIAQTRHESANYDTTEEYAKNGRYAPYIGRTWIQITWQSNYADFGEWCAQQGLISDPNQFVNDPQSLADMKWAGIGAAWYWTVQRPQINSMCDAGDINGVTYAINGGYNGLSQRTDFWNQARAVGDDLLALINSDTQDTPAAGDDELSAEAERMIKEMYDEYRKEKKGPSRSFMATDGALVESPLGFIYNIDGNVWTQQLTWAYLFDVPLALEVVTSVAQNGSYQGSWVASNDFNKWLNEFGQAYCQGLVSFKKALVSKLALSAQQGVTSAASPIPVTNVTNTVDTRGLESEIAKLTAQFGQLQATINSQSSAPAPSAEVALNSSADSTGEKIQRAVDSSMDYTNHVLSMDAAQRTALTRALDSIDPSKGDQA